VNSPFKSFCVWQPTNSFRRSLSHYRRIPEIFQAFRGEFDVTVGRWSISKRLPFGGDMLDRVGRRKTPRVCGYQKSELIPPNKIQFHSPCLRIDLGSIGKGYAVDRAVEFSAPTHQKRPGQRRRQQYLRHRRTYRTIRLARPPRRDPSNKIDPYVLLTENSVSTSEQLPLACSPTNPQSHHRSSKGPALQNKSSRRHRPK